MNNPVTVAIDKLADRFAVELEGARAEFRAGLAQTANALRITGARAQVLAPNALQSTSAGRLAGWSLRETSGSAAATVTLYAGRDAGDPTSPTAQQSVIATIALPAGSSVTIPPSSPGVSFGDGLYAAVTGAVAGCLYFGAVD